MINFDLSTQGCQNIQLVLSASDLDTVVRNVVSDLLSSMEEKKKDELISRKAVNERLHVDNSTLWRWDKTGYLKAVHVGRAVYYHESDIIKIEEGRL